METYKNLIIDVGDYGIVSYIEEVTKIIDDLWVRSYENEENSRYLGEIAYCFRRKQDSSLPGAGLSIFHKEGNTWYVPNIVPIESGQLTFEQYNELLTEFYERYLLPASEIVGVNLDITSGKIEDEDIVGSHAAKLLSTFSECANKSTGSSHPCDQKRWFDFIVEACSSEEHVDAGNLERLLKQQGWSDDASQRLIIQFEFARDIIKHMEK